VEVEARGGAGGSVRFHYKLFFSLGKGNKKIKI